MPSSFFTFVLARPSALLSSIACRPCLNNPATRFVARRWKIGSNVTETLIMKNLFAFIGLCVVLKKGYEFYTEYTDLKHEQRQRADS
jgi:hypothetical protein